MNEVRKKIIESYVDSYNSFNISGMLKNLHPNIVFENFSNGIMDLKTEGLEEFKNQAEKAKAFFEQRTQTIESWQFYSDWVEIAIAYKAIIAIDIPGGPQKGAILELEGTSEFEIDNEYIIRITDKS